MSDRVLVEFVCHPAKGHVYAHVDETPRGREVVIPNMAYTDAGPRVKRWPIEQRLPVESGENWGLAVICACGRRRSLTLGQVELQLGEWVKFNSHTSKPRRVVLDTIT